MVAISGSGCGHVEGLTSHAGAGDDGVRGLDGLALGAVCGGGVAEFDVLADVVRRQGDLPRSAGPPDDEAAVAVGTDDGPLIAVLDPGEAGDEGAVVAAGDDAITYPGERAVRKADAIGCDLPGGDQVGTSAGIQVRDGVSVGGYEQRSLAGFLVGEPGGVSLVQHVA